MPNYDLQLQRTASSTASVGNITAPGSGMRRAWIWDVILGSEAAAADNPFLWQLQRCTTAGTRTAVTPIARDAADAACATTAGQNHTVEPTYTVGAILLKVPLNQRATFRWQVDPRDGLVIPATASNGIGFLTPTMTALAVTADVCFAE
jgi:hypothetical protein